MKILRIVYEWPPPWYTLAPHPLEITRVQAKKGYEVSVMCGRWPKAGPMEKIEGVKFYPIWREPFPGTLALTSSVILFFKYLSWRRKNTVDVIHSHGHFGIWIYWYRSLLKRFFPWSKELKTPLVVHFHNTVKGREITLREKGETISAHARLISWPLEEKSDRWAVKAASAMVFVSNQTKEEAVNYYGANPGRCFVIESGVNPTMFKPVDPVEKEKTRKDIGIDPYSKVIVFHGAVVERKNVHLVVEALKFLPDQFKLLLIGTGDLAYMEKIDNVIRDNNLTGKIIKSGLAPYPQMPIAIQAADVYVLPSKWEGIPKSVMESLACGVPAIVSGFKLSIEIRGLYYLEDVTPQGIAAKIKEVLDSQVGVDYNTVATIYSWEKRVEELDKVYEFAKKNYI